MLIMKKFFITACFFCLAIGTSYSQIVMTHFQLLVICDATFQDPGGNGYYDNNVDIMHSFRSPDGSRFYVAVNSFSLGDGDFLYVYNGSFEELGSVIGVYSKLNVPEYFMSEGDCITFRLISDDTDNGTGWDMQISCMGSGHSTAAAGSPCSSETPFTSICPDVTIWPNTTVVGAGARTFLGTSRLGCISNISYPTWGFFQVEDGGVLNLSFTSPGNFDFAIWGPFNAPSVVELKALFCNGYFDLDTNVSSTSNLIKVLCNGIAHHFSIPFVRSDEWYVFMIANPEAMDIDFMLQSTSTASLNCNVDAQLYIPPVCEGEDLKIIFLDHVSGNSYQLTGPGIPPISTTNDTIIIPQVTLSNSGTYSYTITSPAGQSSGTREVTIYSKPNLELTVSPVCIGSKATVTAVDLSPNGASTSYIWNLGGVTKPGATTFFFPDSEIYCYVTATSSHGCINKDSLLITFNDTNQVVLSQKPICAGSPITVMPIEEDATFNWSSGETTSIVYPVYNASNNIYTVTYTLANNCSFVLSTAVLPKPTANFNPDKDLVTIENGIGRINFTNTSSSDVSSWLWDFDDLNSDQNTSIQPNVYHNYTEQGEYEVSLIVSNRDGCTDTAVKIVEAEMPFRFFIPNSFTPNDDGINDEFCVKGEGITLENFSMRIYDRANNLLYKSEYMYDCWDGKFRGEYCPTGVYVAIIQVVDIDGVIRPYNVAITLVR